MMFVRNKVSNTWPGKVILITLITLTLFTVLAHGYLGPRYGKRFVPQGSSRIVARSSGPRTIQSRSQSRFYIGSRYGGKRSHWPPNMIPSDYTPDLSPPYDCVYLPIIGVRCASLRPENSDRERINDDEDEVYIPPSSGSQTRTAIIDTVPADSQDGGDA